VLVAGQLALKQQEGIQQVVAAADLPQGGEGAELLHRQLPVGLAQGQQLGQHLLLQCGALLGLIRGVAYREDAMW
jgi:hypothetical protein